MYSIPVLTPMDAELLLRYFTGIADVLAKRFNLGFHPDEEHLTSLLCELLDSKGAELHSLSYTSSDLNSDLAKQGSLLHAAISLETSQYDKYQERNFTQADLGIILDYRDNINYSNSFRKGLLIQAKRLFPESDKNYRLNSLYKSFSAEQHHRFIKLREFLHSLGNHDNNKDIIDKRRHMKEGCHHAFQYLLYNPSLNILSQNEQENVLHGQLSRESDSIFDYIHGLFLYEALRKPNGLKSLLELSSFFVDLDTVHSLASSAASNGRSKADLYPFDLRAVTEHIDIRQRSFAWYLVFGFILGGAGCDQSEFLKLVSGSKSSIAQELHIAEPRFVLHVTLTAGTNLEDNMKNRHE